ncbi:MAG: ribosome maturation factor RimM [Chloroflexota bacterium]|nr:ribosome maturation factor RimM [Chloroflexota bacterium]
MSVDPSGEQSVARKGKAAEAGEADSAGASVTSDASPPASQVPAPQVPEHLIVGQVVAPFGVRGEMKVNILTQFPERLAKMAEVILAPYEYEDLGDPTSRRPVLRPRTRTPQGLVAPRKPTPFQVETTRVHKGQLLLKVQGVDTPEAVEVLKNYWVLVPIEKAKKLPKGSYYLYQIVGLEVYDTTRRYIGKIEDVLTLTANDVYVVRGPGVTDVTGELLVPAIKAVVKRFEMKRGRIVIAPIEEWT